MKKSYKQLDDRKVHEEVPNKRNVLINTIMKALEKIPLRSDLSSDTLTYFLVEDHKVSRFYLLLKSHKCLHDVPGRRDIFTLKIYLHF